VQTRDHLFKECAEWRGQQRTLWAEVRKETGKGKNRWKVRDLLADERCRRAVLDFLATTDVGRRVPAPVEEDVQSEASEWELRERREREEERAAEAEGLGAEVEEPLFLPTPVSRIWRDRLLGAAAGAVITAAGLWIAAVSAATICWIFRR
jgi:hypothetical protein